MFRGALFLIVICLVRFGKGGVKNDKADHRHEEIGEYRAFLKSIWSLTSLLIYQSICFNLVIFKRCSCGGSKV